MNTLDQLKTGQLAGTKRLDLSCGLTEFPQEIFELADTLEILNLTNHANAEEFAYDEQFISRSNITGLPILAVAGVSVWF